MVRGKNNRRITNRTKLDIVIVLLSASTPHFDEKRNRISIGDVYRIIRFKNGIKSNRPIRDQIDFLVAQGIAEYMDNKRNVRIKKGSGQATRLFNLIEETPDEAFPYMFWEENFLYRGAYQMDILTHLMKEAKKNNDGYSFNRETMFTRVFMQFAPVSDSIDHEFLKEIGREMTAHIMFLLAKESALNKKENSISGDSLFLSNIVNGLYIAKEEILEDEEGARMGYTGYFKEEIKKFKGVWDIVHNLFFPDIEHHDLTEYLKRSPTALRTVLNYRKAPIEKLFKMSLFSTIAPQNIDGIIKEFTGPWYNNERKKVLIVLRGILGSTGYFQNDEIDRFCKALGRDPNRKWREIEGDQDFQASWLEIRIKGIIRHNHLLNLTGHKTKSPMLLALSSYHYIDSIDSQYDEDTAFSSMLFRSVQSVYAPHEIDKLINYRFR